MLFAAACTTGRRGASPWSANATVADSLSTETLAPGVVLHQVVRVHGPLRATVLDIDLSRCVDIRAVKGNNTAVGRSTTSALLSALPSSMRAIAAVNADFFLFTPPGVPVGAMIEDGRLVSGPVSRPVFALDAARRPYIGPLAITTALIGPRDIVVATSYNRPARNAVGVVSAAWAQPLDSLVRPSGRMLVPVGMSRETLRYVVASLPAAHSSVAQGDTLLLVGRTSTLAEGDTITLQQTWAPITPYNAVGAFPLLVRDSVIVPTVDSDGAESFRGLNPRTAVGYADNGRRILLVVIDGRQAGKSVGTTIRETAALLRDLGAREAVNLDGGGSSAMVVRDLATGKTRVVNSPSDATGERAVANALVVTGQCRR